MQALFPECQGMYAIDIIAKNSLYTELTMAYLRQNSKQVTELKAEVERLMFLSEKDPIVMTEDSVKFQSVMCAFHHYEKSVSI